VAPAGGGPSAIAVGATVRAAGCALVGRGGGGSLGARLSGASAFAAAGRTESTGALTRRGAIGADRADSTSRGAACAAARDRGATVSGRGDVGGGGRSAGALSRLGGGGAACAPSDATGAESATAAHMTEMLRKVVMVSPRLPE
jgi:hypothetical protein